MTQQTSLQIIQTCTVEFEYSGKKLNNLLNVYDTNIDNFSKFIKILKKYIVYIDVKPFKIELSGETRPLNVDIVYNCTGIFDGNGPGILGTIMFDKHLVRHLNESKFFDNSNEIYRIFNVELKYFNIDRGDLVMEKKHLENIGKKYISIGTENQKQIVILSFDLLLLFNKEYVENKINESCKSLFINDTQIKDDIIEFKKEVYQKILEQNEIIKNQNEIIKQLQKQTYFDIVNQTVQNYETTIKNNNEQIIYYKKLIEELGYKLSINKQKLDKKTDLENKIQIIKQKILSIDIDGIPEYERFLQRLETEYNELIVDTDINLIFEIDEYTKKITQFQLENIDLNHKLVFLQNKQNL